MIRLFFIAFFAAIAVMAGMMLKSCTWIVGGAGGGADTSILALPDGRTMEAQPGTVRRELLEWLEHPDATSHSFFVGGQEFEPGTARLTQQSIARIPRLAQMMKAYPHIHATVIGHARSIGNPQAEQALGLARAQTVVDVLSKDGIAPGRLGAQSRGAQEPLNPDRPSVADERVTLILSREPA